jgi:hypothetical protein
LDYPGNFETPANPAGTRIAVSRFMAICASVMFLVIVFLCGILIWSSRSDKLVPFLISTNNDTGEWAVVGRASPDLEYSVERTMQESVIGNFARQWFKISKDDDENDDRWKKCERTACAASGACAIYCASGDELFSRFMFEVLPDYKSRVSNGEAWELDEKTMVITPAGAISEVGGTWQIQTSVRSNFSGVLEIKAFVKVARNKAYYPQTMGFYVADFNAYRMN